MELKEKTLKKEYVYEGRIINVRSDTAEQPDGLIVPREVVEHPGGVGIALEDAEGKFFFVRQWRYAQYEETLEYPAGKKEKGEILSILQSGRLWKRQAMKEKTLCILERCIPRLPMMKR